MRKLLIFFILFWLPYSVFAQNDISIRVSSGKLIIPSSSIPQPAGRDHTFTGRRAHTTHLFFIPDRKKSIDAPLPNAETPASISCIYGLTRLVTGCPIAGTTAVPTGGSGVIGIVVAYDYPQLESDLNVFSTQYGLPACTTGNGCFTKVFATGTQPPFNESWASEAVMDVEWVHAMAPNARILLVEAATESDPDLFFAEDVASDLIASQGGGIISNSWEDFEMANERSFDQHFQKPGIVYFFSSGDMGAPPLYPSSSPYVISVGGTRIIRDHAGNFTGEEGWSLELRNGLLLAGGGGPSKYEPRPAYQWSVEKITGNARGTPDIAAVADPFTGISVYNSSKGGWTIGGGTSASTPIMAGIFNTANSRARSSTEALNMIYEGALKNYHDYWHDILVGFNRHKALNGYDFVTGLGSPRTYAGK